MLRSLYSLLILFTFITFSSAQHNVTINSTSPSIKYEGNAGDALICKINSTDGTLISGQPGCYNAPSQCTEGAAMGQGGSGAASFTFKGSAIYINSLLNYLSPTYTVTLDGKSTDVDGVRSSGAFVCSPLFSQSNLDPNVEHQIRLSVKGPSPTRNQSIPGSENFFVFSLLSFVYTEGSANNTGSTSSSTTLDPSTVITGNIKPVATNSPSSAELLRSSGLLLLLGAALATGFILDL